MDTFSNKYIKDWNILTKAIIGFEFEFYTERSYYKLLELLNRELDPIRVHGFRKYHSSMEVDDKNFKIEPDLSGGPELIELITGPLPYLQTKIILLKILRVLKEYATTNEKTSLHINISFNEESGKRIEEINPLKIILNVDEDMIYEYFPDRKNNFYAMSVKNLIPFKNFDYIGSSSAIIENNIELPDTKYRGININKIKKGRLEYRYIGGDNYHLETEKILELMDYFILLSWNSINEKIDKDDKQKLLKYLSDNINNFKTYQKYENFIGNFPSIILKVNGDNSQIIIKTYYPEMYEKIYELISNIYNLSNCIINFNTFDRKIEIVDADFKSIMDIEDVRLIDCSISGGRFIDCDIETCDVSNAHLYNSNVHGTDIYNCKIINTNVDHSTTIKESYFHGGVLDGYMESGVFRGGKLGENYELGNKVEVVRNKDSYFGLHQIEDIDKKKKMK